eukprot:TRINITY_DN16062_c0_g1_i1.p1 TRINITY_DN16062_c0_g1~~TRINITY_DN16062_c0_g1_i1.p1  ORF type:complete len:128 (+),score=51.52 TRINITY_DN16062_c0_g1_i1:77-460(+)
MCIRDRNEHDYYLELHERLQKLKQEEATWKKAIAEGKLPNDLHNEDEVKMKEEKLFALQKRIAKQEAMGRRTIEELNVQIADYILRIKEEEEKCKQSSERLALVRNKVKHSKLQPISVKDLKAKPAC